MTFGELNKLVEESCEQLKKCGATASRIVIANRLKPLCLEEHHRYCKGDPTTYYGLPLEFADLPEYLVFYIESEYGGESGRDND